MKIKLPRSTDDVIDWEVSVDVPDISITGVLFF